MADADLKILSIKEAIRSRPGVYIGGRDTPDQLVSELLDNSLDELSKNYANKVYLKIQDSAIDIFDNGRGLPNGTTTDSEGKTHDSIEAIFTIPHSGTKFDNKDYDTSIGQNGLGLVAVNALSEKVYVLTKDREKKKFGHAYMFEDFDLVKKNNFIKLDKDMKEWSTCIKCIPLKNYFISNDIDIEGVKRRLHLIKFKYPSSKLIFNDEQIEIKDKTAFLAVLAKTKSVPKSFYKVSRKTDLGNIDIYFTIEEDDDSFFAGEVNSRECDGTYLTSFQTILKNAISKKLRTRFQNVNNQYYLLGIKSFIFMNIREPMFDSQTKTRLKTDIKPLFLNDMEEDINKIVSKDEFIQITIRNLENKFSRKLNEDAAAKSQKRFSISAGSKLSDCDKHPGTLYIVEGDSAGGLVKRARNPKYEAVFPVRGKILNVEKSTIEKISENEEIKYLKEALGPKSARRYNRVCILADGDPDGYQISCLAALCLWKIADDLVTEGKVDIVLPPLYGAIKIEGKKKTFIPIYDINDINQYSEKGYTIKRFKGLGEMNPDELEVVLKNNLSYTIAPPKTEEEQSLISNVIHNVDLKRKMMNESNISLDILVKPLLDEFHQRESSEKN